MKLNRRLEDTLIFNGKKVRLNLSFDVVLTVMEAFEDPCLTEAEKLWIALRLLVRNRRVLRRLFPAEKGQLLEQIMNSFILPQKGNPSFSSSEPVLDFIQDAEYLYSSFYLDYGIDLLEERGRMHWQKFSALLKGLSKETKMSEIMEIRQRPIPQPDRYNAQEIRAL